MLNVDDLPIKSTIHMSSLQDGNYIAKSGISFKNWKGDNIILGGYSYGIDRELALEKSRYEVIERLFAHFDFHKKKINWTGYSVSNPLESKIYDHSEVLLGEFPSQIQSADSSGLSYHENLELAIRHAVYELIERNILCEIWFRKIRKIQMIDEETLGLQGFKMRVYTTDDLPFALTFVYSPASSVVFAGSSFSDSLDFSINKSKSEAFMMLESWHARTNLFCHSPNTLKRLAQIGDANFYNFFQTTIGNITSLNKSESSSFIDLMNSIYIVKIITKQSAHLVRAISDKLLCLKKCRAQYKHMVPYDPFF